MKFARLDKQTGLLGRGVVRFDLRVPGKMIVRLPRAPGEPIAPPPPGGLGADGASPPTNRSLPRSTSVHPRSAR